MGTFILFRYHLRRFVRGAFFRNVAVVASGTAASQAIVMAFSPIVTRLYGPEAFGLLGTFTAAAAIFVPISALSYPVAIVLPKDDNEARNICRLSICIALGFSSVVALLISIGGGWIVATLKVQTIEPYIYLIPLFIVLAAWYQITQQWMIRKQQYTFIVRVGVVHALIVNCAKAGIGMYKPMAGILVWIYNLGTALHAGMLTFGFKTNDYRNVFFKNNPQSSLKKVAIKYYDFPLYRAPQMFLNSTSQGLPVIILTTLFGPIAAGFFTLSKNVLNMPTMLIGKSVGDVFYPKVAESIHKNEPTSPLLIKSTLALAAVGFVPFLIVIIWGPNIFTLVFGKEWFKAGEYSRWIALWSYFILITRPAVASIPVYNLQSLYLIFEVISLVLRLFGLYLGYYLFSNDVYSIAVFSLVNSFLYTCLMCGTFSAAKIADYKLLKIKNMKV